MLILKIYYLIFKNHNLTVLGGFKYTHLYLFHLQYFISYY